jgi:branched-chain amino acid transport system substrate-binding protein
MKKIIAALFLALLPVAAHADIVWAVAGPYTGSVASIGQSQQAGIKQAAEDINATGGISGQKITLKIYDDACDPEQAVTIANKIVSDNLHLILHGSCSGASIAAEKVYLDEGDIVINSMSSNPKITDNGGPTLFRAMARDDDAATVIAGAILKQHRNAKLAIIHDKSTYGQSIAEYVRDRLNKGGFKEILFEPYDPNNHDYSVLATRLKQVGADAVFIGGYPVEAAMITRQLHEAGAKIQIFAGDLSDPDFWKIAGKTGEGASSAFPSDPRKEAGAKDVTAKLQKAGVTVDGYTLYAYASAQVMAQAMAKAASSDPAKIAAAIHKGEFSTILGKWSFDDKGDVRDIRTVMYHWQGGQFMETGE